MIQFSSVRHKSIQLYSNSTYSPVMLSSRIAQVYNEINVQTVMHTEQRHDI